VPTADCVYPLQFIKGSSIKDVRTDGGAWRVEWNADKSGQGRMEGLMDLVADL